MSKFDDFLKEQTKDDVGKKVDEIVNNHKVEKKENIVETKTVEEKQTNHKDDTKFTDEDRKKIIKKYLGNKRIRFSRRERKLIENMEYD
ncbi:MAG: hypothetical protein DRN24_06710, partial [Thermoplasmata archaeon]